jgi:hypothetical protein
MQKQKQRLQTKQPELAAGVRAIAILDLLLGVPLALTILIAFLQEPIPRDSAGLIFGVLAFTFVLAINGAGVCLLLRRRALARVFQWLLAIFALLYFIFVGYFALHNGLTAVPLVILLGASFAALMLVTLAIVLQRFGED